MKKHKIIKLLDKYSNAIRELVLQEGYEYADPNRATTYYAEKAVKKLKNKIKKMFIEKKGL